MFWPFVGTLCGLGGAAYLFAVVETYAEEGKRFGAALFLGCVGLLAGFLSFVSIIVEATK